MSYNWTVLDVFQLLGIQTNRNKVEVNVPCPFCNSKHFGMNQQKGVGHCFKCGQPADSASYYAETMGLSIEEARKDIERRLNIKDDKGYRPERIVYKEVEQSPIAKIDVLDKTYRAFLAELTLCEKNKNALLARGFSESDIKFLGYKTFPKEDYADFRSICKRLMVAGNNLKGVPGFYQDKNGDWTFIRCTQGIVMPQRTINNEIFGLQIRKDDDLRTFKDEDTGELEAKCVWFSSKNCPNGCGSVAQINFSCDFKYDKKSGRYWPYFKNKKVVLTEGSMKADLIHSIKPEWPIISVAGVNSTTYLDQVLKILKKLGVEAVLHAYDMDYQTNPNVQDALQRTEKIIRENMLEYKQAHWNTDIILEGVQRSLLKGLDDYLAYIEKGVIPKVVEK